MCVCVWGGELGLNFSSVNILTLHECPCEPEWSYMLRGTLRGEGEWGKGNSEAELWPPLWHYSSSSVSH